MYYILRVYCYLLFLWYKEARKALGGNMFHQLSTLLPQGVSHRLWLRRHESIAAKQPSRWTELAQQFTLKYFGSFNSPDGICLYRYETRPIGEIRCDAQGKPITNTLSDFFNAMRMVVEAYERMIIISDQFKQTGATTAHTIVVLQPIELEMLKNHPNYTALVQRNKREYKQTIRLVETGSHVYRIEVKKL